MTRHRMFGSDTPFCDWMRKHPGLPSYSKNFGIVASDNDLTLHSYMNPIDGIGSRDIQAMMHLEIKTRGGDLTSAQKDTLFKLNAFLYKGKASRIETKDQSILHFGVSILRMEGIDPETSQWMKWGRFINQPGQWSPVYREIDLLTLLELMRFEKHPHSLEKNTFRRHHKTSEIVVQTTSPLGFDYEEKVTKRS